MASRNGKRNGFKQRRLLNYVYNLHKRKCQNCKKHTWLAFRLMAKGYINNGRGYLIKGSTKLPVATVEHVIPLCNGGVDDRSNVTLYCWACNNKAAKSIRIDAGRIARQKQINAIPCEFTEGFNEGVKIDFENLPKSIGQDRQDSV